MVDWELTATTVFCEAVGDEVTLMVYGDGTVKCTGEQKYGKPDKAASRALAQQGKKLGRKLACEGIQCARATGYRDKLLSRK